MRPWTAPQGDGEGAIAALIAATSGGMAIMLWTQRPSAPAGDPALDAACVLAALVAVVAASAGGLGLLRRHRRAKPARPTPRA
ncbi:MAG: hypothetical protein ACLFTG_04795 [Alphaproteobacteria bacterium]